MTLTESFKKEGLKEGLEKARQESVKNQKKTLTDILTLRFGTLGQALQIEFDQIESEKLLGKLIVSAATVKKLDQFKLK